MQISGTLPPAFTLAIDDLLCPRLDDQFLAHCRCRYTKRMGYHPR